MLFLGLKDNRSVTWLDVSGNQLTGFLPLLEHEIDDEFDLDAIRSISLALAENDTIKHLNLRDNRCSPAPFTIHLILPSIVMPKC